MLGIFISVIAIGCFIGFFVQLFRGCMRVVDYITDLKTKEHLHPRVYKQQQRETLKDILINFGGSSLSLLILVILNWSGAMKYAGTLIVS